MRLIETVAEFASYGIQNHVDADLDGCANELRRFTSSF